MSRNDANDYAQRLYARVPAYYRTYDLEQGQPLLALLRVVAEQVANIRADLDGLWDNFFIETCDDWVVPYLGGLVGTNLLPQPVGQSNRLDVRNTVRWRRTKGTPAMLGELATAISGWPTDVAEFFRTLGWSQNVNHPRPDDPLTPDLRDPARLVLLGRASDPFAHAADFRVFGALDQPRLVRGGPILGSPAWETPGRHQIKNVGFFVRRLRTYRLTGVTPAAASPGVAPAPDASCFTFDPLFRNAPLFVQGSAEPLRRATFGQSPWTTFGSNVAVRQFGVLLASEVEPTPDRSSSQVPFTFGGRGAGLALDPASGMRLMDARAFQSGGTHFVLSAGWFDGSATTELGALSTLLAARDQANAFHPGGSAAGTGQLVITVRTGRPAPGWPALPSSPAGRFPGAVLAVRATRSDPPREDDGLYVYLPPARLTPADALTYFVADDGSAYTGDSLDPTTLARPSDGQVYPPRLLTSSTRPASAFCVLNRGPGGMVLVDPSRFGGAAVLVEAEIFTGAFQLLGGIATITQPGTSYPELSVPDPWPAYTYGPSTRAVADDLPSEGLLAIRLRPLAGDFLPAAELVVANRAGQSLLVYLPEAPGVGPDGIRVFVAEDGSTYNVPPDEAGQLAVLQQGDLSGLRLARASAGQVLPIPGVWPLQQRAPVALDLCRCERSALLAFGELGIDPELGRFALASGDPSIGRGALSVDYVEGFAGDVGARTFDRQIDPRALPTRLVARSGDAASDLNPTIGGDHIHATVADALAAAADGDVIEIVDSASYPMASEILLDRPAVRSLTLRAAAGQRPCLAFFQADGTPTAASLHLASPLDSLELGGLLISGGPIRIDGQIANLLLVGCTLDPASGAPAGALVAADGDLDHRASYVFCRCIAGGIATGAGVSRIVVADSIVDRPGDTALGGAPPGTAAQTIQLERATVLGRILGDVLSASDSLLDDVATVEDQQSGCIRFSRYERGSTLPRKYQCVPTDAQDSACPADFRCLAPRFSSRAFGRPDYLQLATTCPPPILTASEAGAEVGAFAGVLNTTRLNNLNLKLREFLPVGLTAVVVAET